MGPFRTILVALLLAIWPAMTSHSLLELAGFIHVVHHDHHEENPSNEHSAGNHAFADGDYTSVSAAKSLKKPESAFVPTALVQCLSSIASLQKDDSPGPAPPGAAPPHLQSSWSFLLRTALPVRAPSFLS